MNKNEYSFYKGIQNYEKETSLVKAKGKNISFINYSNIEVFGQYHVISPCAYLSINNQIQVKGVGFSDLSEELTTHIYNEGFQSDRLRNKDFLLIFVQGLLKAIMVSGEVDGRGYSYYKTSKIIDTLIKDAKKRRISLHFEDGIFDDYYTVITYQIKKTYYPGYTFYVTLADSITGYSSIRFIPSIERGRLRVELKDDTISIEHKGDIEHKLESVMKEIDNSFMRITKRFVEDLDKPIESIEKLCRDLGLNKRKASYVLHNFKGETLDDFLDFIKDIDFVGPSGQPKEVLLGQLFRK